MYNNGIVVVVVVGFVRFVRFVVTPVIKVDPVLK
jgi:hypothetical protein